MASTIEPKDTLGRPNLILFIGIVLIIIKIWITMGLAVSAQNFLYDDRLYLNLSNFIINGKWLGPYNFTTLTKGSGYPLWISLSFLGSIPLLLSQQLLYAFSCGILVHALTPLLKWKYLALFILAALLFDPQSYSTRLLRLCREGIYSSLTLLVFAGLFGMVINRSSNLKKFSLWSATLGLSLSFFWITREEGIWIMPSCGLLIAYCVYMIWRDKLHDRRWRLSITILPFLLLGLSIICISTVNYLNYKVFCTVESKTSSFANAFGALTRVEHNEWNRYLPVPASTRSKIYLVSPSFRRLKPYLEGYIGQKWADFSTSRLGSEYTKNDIGGGWFLWALRESAAAAGLHDNAAKAMEFYDELGQEINSACTDGKLKCESKRSSIIVPFRSEYVPYLWQASIDKIKVLLSYDLNKPQQLLSNIDVPGYIAFTDITLGKVAQPVGENMPTPNQNNLNYKKIQWMNSIYSMYKSVISYIAGLAIICFILSLINAIISRRISLLLIFNIAVLGAILSRILILAYIEMTSFSSSTYLGPAYSLVILFSFLAIHDLFYSRKGKFPTFRFPS